MSANSALPVASCKFGVFLYTKEYFWSIFKNKEKNKECILVIIHFLSLIFFIDQYNPIC